MEPMRSHILIIDDDAGLREILRDRLEVENFEVSEAKSGEEGLARLRDREPDVVLLDLQLPGRDGFDLLEQFKVERVDSAVVMMTAYGSIEKAVEAMRYGAFDFVTKPFGLARICAIVARGAEHARLRREIAYYREVAAGEMPSFVVESPAMRDVVETARKAAMSSATVLLLGESGTGKEVLARAIHRWSARCERPYVTLNCVALSPGLLESELFGHEKGAFTGADSQRRGRFEQARNGTLLLDEIGATEAGLQLKLLRVLQEGTFERVGGNQSHRADVRIIAATNRNLTREVEEGRFLADLYYRLSVVPIQLPPLRERREDVPALVHYFLQKYALEARHELLHITPRALQRLREHDWPGNVRELENCIVRAVVLGSGAEIDLDDLPEHLLQDTGGEEGLADGYHALVAEHKRQILTSALHKSGGNQTRAAELLGLQRTYFARLIKQLGIK